MDFLEVADRVIRSKDMQHPGDGNALQRQNEPRLVSQSMSELATYAQRQELDRDQQMASLLSLEAIQVYADELDETVSVASRLMNWMVETVGRGVVRFVFRSIWDLVTWLVREIVTLGVRFVGWALAEIVTASAGALLAGLGPVLGGSLIALGAGTLIYAVWKSFFDKDLSIRPGSGPDLAGLPVGAGSQYRSTLISPAESLKALIARGEGDYNSVNRGAAHGYRSGTEDLENMTVNEVMAHQAARDFNAVGRYQIIRDTLPGIVRGMGLTGNEKFDRNLQDRMFEYLITVKRKAIGDYLEGRSNDLQSAVYAVSMEWASVATPAGLPLFRKKKTDPIRYGDGKLSYYSSVGNNKASITANEMAQVLERERAKNTGKAIEGPDGVTTAPPITLGQTTLSAESAIPVAPGQTSSKETQIVKVSKGVFIKLN